MTIREAICQLMRAESIVWPGGGPGHEVAVIVDGVPAMDCTIGVVSEPPGHLVCQIDVRTAQPTYGPPDDAADKGAG